MGLIKPICLNTVKPVLRGHTKRRPKLVFKTDYRLMQVKSIAECSKHSSKLLTFIKLPFVIKFIVLSILEWALKTGFTVIRVNKVEPHHSRLFAWKKDNL